MVNNLLISNNRHTADRSSAYQKYGKTFRYLALIAVLVTLVFPAYADDPWQGPYKGGVALWHLDAVENGQSSNAIAAGTPVILQDGARLDETEAVYGHSVQLNDGSLRANGVSWKGSDRSLEAFFRLDAYPPAGKEACLFALVDERGTVVHSLTVTADGSVKCTYGYADYLQKRYRERTTLSLPAGSLPRGEWVHVALHALGYYQMVRLSINGRILGEEHGSMFEGVYTLYVGNTPAGDQPLAGRVDEVRQATARAFSPYLPPQRWVNPGTPPPPERDPRYFPNADSLLFYCNFDGMLDPSEARGEKKYDWPKENPAPLFADGIHGKALTLGCPMSYPAPVNIKPESGAFSCWVKAQRDPKATGQFFKIGGGWQFMLSGAHNLGAVNPAGRTDYAMNVWGPLTMLRPGRWHHVVLTWQGEWLDLYLDGQHADCFLVPNGLAPYLAAAPTISMGASWVHQFSEAWVDEYRIFGQALSPEEVGNLYRVKVGEPLQPVTARRSIFHVYAGVRKIVAHVNAPADGLEMTMTDAQGKVIAHAAQARTIAGAAEMVLDYPLLPKGDYRVTVHRIGRQPGIDDVFIYHHQDYPWLREKAGESEKVLPPWTPVAVTGNRVEVWNRAMTLDGCALPQALDAGGKPLLAEGAYFEMQQPDGAVVKLRNERERPELLSATPAKAIFRGMASTAAVSLTLDHEIEYDGCSKLTLNLRPGSAPGEISRLTLVLPLTESSARYLYAKGRGIREQYLARAVPNVDGLVFASHIIKACGINTDPLAVLADYRRLADLRRQNKPIPKELDYLTARKPDMSSGSFLPYIWLGSPERGLCWFADSDRGWTRGDDRTPAIEVIRRQQDGRIELRVNFIARLTTITTPRQIVFGLMATPAKPLAPDWRTQYWYREAKILGFGYEFTSGRYYLGRGRPGMTGGGEPFPWNLQRAQWFSKIAKGNNWLQVTYQDACNTYAEIPDDLNYEWRQQPQGWQLLGGIRTMESYADWYMYYYAQYIRDAGLDGLYLDNFTLTPSLNEYAHGAWRDENGELQPTYNLWELRDFLKRLRTLFVEAGVEHPWIQVHNTHVNLAPVLSFADVLYEGEDFYIRPDEKRDFMDSWPLDALTAIDCPQTWGIPVHFLGNTAGGDWSKRPGGVIGVHRTAMAAQLLLDIKGGNYQMADVFAAMRQWGVDKADCRFIGYWNNDFSTADPEVKVSAYRRPDSLLLVVTNFSHTAKTATIRFAPDGLPFTPAEGEAREIEYRRITRGNEVSIALAYPDFNAMLGQDGKEWTLSAGAIPPRDFRLISVSRRENVKP